MGSDSTVMVILVLAGAVPMISGLVVLTVSPSKLGLAKVMAEPVAGVTPPRGLVANWLGADWVASASSPVSVGISRDSSWAVRLNVWPRVMVGGLSWKAPSSAVPVVV